MNTLIKNYQNDYTGTGMGGSLSGFVAWGYFSAYLLTTNNYYLKHGKDNQNYPPLPLRKTQAGISANFVHPKLVTFSHSIQRC